MTLIACETCGAVVAVDGVIDNRQPHAEWHRRLREAIGPRQVGEMPLGNGLFGPVMGYAEDV